MVRTAGRMERDLRQGVVGVTGRSAVVVAQQDLHVLALVKGEERYLFLFDEQGRAETLRTLGRFASNPELSFSWYDAAVLSQRVRDQTPPPSGIVPAPHMHKRRFELPASE